MAGIFDTSRLTEQQRHYFEKVVTSYDYDWERMKPLIWQRSNYYNDRRRRIVVTVEDIPAQYGAAAQTWPSGRIQIDDQVTPDAVGPESWLWYMQCVVHELGHVAEFFDPYLMEYRERNKPTVVEMLGWDGWVGCDFCNPFARAFSNYKVGRSTTTDVGPDVIKKLRKLMGGKGIPPIPKIEMVP